MKQDIVVSCDLKDLFNFFDSLNVKYTLYLDPEGISFYVCEENIFVDLVVYDYKYSFIATLYGVKYDGDDLSYYTLKDNKIFKKILEKNKK